MIIIDGETVQAVMDWPRQIAALRAGHQGPRPKIDDLLMRQAGSSLLVRVAWAPEAGIGLKAVTIFPHNRDRTPPLPAIQGQFLLFDGDHGGVSAVIDGAAITAWKTAGDSALGADLLARHDVATLTMIGAGAMAEGDVVCCATMSTEPVVPGEALKPGAHLDLVGAFTPDMREADDAALKRGRLFVDARESTIHEIGELIIPLKAGVITEADVLGDLFDLVAGKSGRSSDEEITIYKNGGGAHLDLMTARAIHAAQVERQG